MKKLNTVLMELSICDEIKALKVLIASLIGIFLSSFTHYISATTTVITISIIFAFLPSVSATRTYCIQRIVVNVIGAVITLVIGILLKWDIYSLAIISSVTMLIYYKFNLAKRKLSLVSLIAASLVFFMIMSTPSATESRFVSIIIGSILAILVNELVLPLNQGFKLEKVLFKFNKDLFKIQDSLLENVDNLSLEDFNTLNKSLNSIKPNIDLLEKELETTSLTNHLRHYRTKIGTLKMLGDVSTASYNLLYLIFNQKEQLQSISSKDKHYIKEAIEELSKSHKIFLANYKENLNFNSIPLIELNKSHLNLNKDTNILILSNLIIYKNSLKKIKDIA
ncbi:FUSC family protein [uncultured Clostridium sp.]|uniref:FUSC family protein n=1 Tax=uncultured Clostridium sp. TaxID=59620 RepID=UPI00260E6530|nr:FUSC family protein [uncultured Clostridium sp.]